MKKAFKRKPVLRSKALKTVPGKGLEPPCLAALVPETSTSTNFATRANKFDNSQTNSVSDGGENRSSIVIVKSFSGLLAQVPRIYLLLLYAAWPEFGILMKRFEERRSNGKVNVVTH